MGGQSHPPKRGAWGLCLYIDSPCPKPPVPKGAPRLLGGKKGVVQMVAKIV